MRKIILLLAASVALMMTGFGIIMPVFARRLGEFGAGVEALGLMIMAFSLAQLVASPFMGTLADRFGRRPWILVALAAFALANVGYLIAQSTLMFILVRAVAGALTAGLFPAAMGVVADLVPEKKRAQWIGIVMGGYGAGMIFGPVLGGFLYDGWGFAAPFAISGALGLIALICAGIMVPETRPHAVRRREALRQRRIAAGTPTHGASWWASLPRPLHILGMLLLLDFVSTFAFTFVEPQMVFYLYDELGWSTIRFGLVVGVYGLAMVFGQTVLGQASDRFGRKPIIVVGLLLNTTLYFGIATVTAFPLMLLVCAVAGLGAALISPALSAFYLDITPEQHRSRVVGIKESSLSLGGVAGPLLVVVAAGFTTPKGIFIIAGLIMLFGTLLALAVLRSPRPAAEEMGDVAWEIANKRSLAAQTSLRGIVMRAATERERHDILRGR
jgi:multidrug resistance protein